MKTFSDRVVARVLEIPAGRVSTYGRIAKAAGAPPMAAQSVTAILGRASEGGVDIPFHRIVYADGRIWVDEKHRAKRMKLYKEEGSTIDARDRVENFAKVLYKFD